jgi:hypothetical protein
MNPRVKEVQYRAPYKLLLTFANDERKQFDLLPYLDYPVYSPLKDESYCRKAKVLWGTVAWDETVDFDPDTLYLESEGVA